MYWVSHESFINGIRTSNDLLWDKECQGAQDDDTKHRDPDALKCQGVEHVQPNKEQDQCDAVGQPIASGIAFTGEICRFTVTNQGGHLVLSEILLSPA